MKDFLKITSDYLVQHTKARHYPAAVVSTEISINL